MKPKHWKIRVPIYEVNLHLVVAEDVVKESKKYGALLGFLDDDQDFQARCAYDKWNFGLFFHGSDIRKGNHGIIAHEIFHLTHRIMQFVQQDFEIKKHESHALLHEWLTNWVYRKLKSVK